MVLSPLNSLHPVSGSIYNKQCALWSQSLGNDVCFFFFLSFFKNTYLTASALYCGLWNLPLQPTVSLVEAHGLSYSVVCEILVPQSGIEPAPPTLQGGFFTTEPPGKPQEVLIDLLVFILSKKCEHLLGVLCFQKVAFLCAKSLQSCPTLWDPMDCSLPGSSVHGILQVRTLEWVAISSSGDLPDPVIEPGSLTSLALAGRFFTAS